MPASLKKKIQALDQDNRYDEIVALIQAHDGYAEDAGLVIDLACALNNLRRYDDALSALESVRSKASERASWHAFRGYALFHKSDLSGAAACLRQAVDLDPRDGFARDFLDTCEDALEREVLNDEARRSWDAPSRAPGAKPFEGFDLDGFWLNDGADEEDEYLLPPPTDEDVRAVEAELGYTLPASYMALMRHRNGGIPNHGAFPTGIATSWADDHVAVDGIIGIGSSKPNSLCGSTGSRFMLDEWGYPEIGIVIADCPSAGHDVIMLDYRRCGPQGEPEVVHVDQESDYAITWLAPTFEDFVRGLVPEDRFDEEG